MGTMSSVFDDMPVVASGVGIYEHIQQSLDLSGRLPAEVVLPDEAKVTTGRLRWVPGAQDAVLNQHGPGGHDADRAETVAGLIGKTCRKPSARTLRALYDSVASDDVTSYIDRLIERLAQERLDRQALHTIGRWLATSATDRGPVKVGIALLGLTGLGADVAIVRALGAHEEFTLYCAVAMANGLADPESELWALAASVDGWGRIHCVQQLRNTTDPDIRRWILREGFRNTVMYEYLAYLAATTGGLLDALRGEVDRPLLTAAGEIIEALISGGPAEDIDDYTDAADAIEAFLTLMTTRAETLRDFSAVSAIRAFLTRDDGWDERGRRGWWTTRREACEAACERILSRDAWIDRVSTGLACDDDIEFLLADRAARALGMDTFDIHLNKITADPLGNNWFDAWCQADTARAVRLAELARTLLPIDEIATGPADELGLGPGWRPHTALDWTLQALRDYPGIGADLLVAGLRSPVTRNRNMALAALQSWPPSTWPAPARTALADLARSDPNDRTRRLAAELTESYP